MVCGHSHFGHSPSGASACMLYTKESQRGYSPHRVVTQQHCSQAESHRPM